MQKNIFSRILIVLVSVFVIGFAMTTYRYYVAIHSDDPIDPYVSVELGQTTIIRDDLAIDMTKPESYSIMEGDIIITKADSLALVAWPDHSITRLGANSRLIIKEMRVASDYSKIELVAVLENGKAWTNIVRTLYPDSRVEFRLPKSGTVAGVRGTVFEINLDANYIHGVEHSISLRNSFGKVVTLLPGEAVSATDIFKKIESGLDNTWIVLNTTKDSVYTTARDIQLRTTYNILTGKAQVLGVWDSFVRWILSFFDTFRDIKILTAMTNGDVSQLMGIPQNEILKWYQTFQSTDFVQERDQLRGVIISLKDSFLNGDKIIDTLTRGAIWDIQKDPTLLLKNAQGLIGSYAKKTGTTLDILMSNISKFNPKNITSESNTLYEQWLK